MSTDLLIQLLIRQNELQEATLLEMRGIHEILQSMTEKPLPQDEWLDNADLKVLLKMSDVSIWRMRRDTQIACKKIAGKWYYSKKAILKLLEGKS